MKVTVLSDASAPSLVLALVPAFAVAADIPAEDARRMGTVVARLVSFILDNAYPDDDLGEIEVTLDADDGVVHVAVHDWGLPLTSAGGDFGPLPEPLASLPPDARDVRLRVATAHPDRDRVEAAPHRGCSAACTGRRRLARRDRGEGGNAGRR